MLPRPGSPRPLVLLLLILTAFPVSGQQAAVGVLRVVPVPEEVALTRPLVRFNGSEFLIVEQGNDEVWLVDVEGNGATRIGRRGQGPGEYINPSDGGWLGDSIWIADISLRRMIVFRPDFVQARTDRLNPDQFRNRSLYPVTPLPHGGQLTSTLRLTTNVLDGGIDTYLLWNDSEGQPLQQLRLDTRLGDLVAQGPEGAVVHAQQPFTEIDRFDVSPGLPGVWVVQPTDTGIRASRAPPVGDGIVVDVPLNPVRLTDSEIRDWTERFLRGLDDAASAFERPVEDALERPDNWPRFDAVVAGFDGEIWIRHPDGSPGEAWSRVCPSGEQVTIRVETDLEALIPGGQRLFGLRTGPFDDPQLVELSVPDDFVGCGTR